VSDTGSSAVGGEQRGVRARIAVAAATADPGLDGLTAALQRVCRATAGALGHRGAAVHVVTRTGTDSVVAASDERSRELAELPFAANEGPCFDAVRTRRPILVANLAQARDRWPGFVDLAWTRGLRGVFVFPIHEGAVSFGVLEVYADRTGPLTVDQQATAVALARVATELFIDGNSALAAADLERGIGASMVDRARIYQAQGMVMVDLGITLAEALARMRARAFTLDITLLGLADQVIAGSLSAESWRDGEGGGA